MCGAVTCAALGLSAERLAHSQGQLGNSQIPHHFEKGRASNKLPEHLAL